MRICSGSLRVSCVFVASYHDGDDSVASYHDGDDSVATHHDGDDSVATYYRVYRNWTVGSKNSCQKSTVRTGPPENLF